MRFNFIEIQNYKSFWENQVIKLETGFNIFLGANNSGKTTALEVMDLNNTNVPHKSIRNLANYGDVETKRSKFKVGISTNLAELDKLVAKPLFIPLPDNLSELGRNNVYDKLIEGQEIELLVDIHNAYYSTFQYGANSSHTFSNIENTALTALSLKEKPRVGKYPSFSTSANSSQVVANYFQAFLPYIYRFNADRRPASISAFSNPRLERDASNLPFCINHLQSNDAHGHKILCQWINKVFPSIPWVQAIPVPGQNNFELRCLPLLPQYRRDDLSVPLARMGSGIGNVIAMFYVVLTSRQPQVIAIDEPNSFLHPKALRELLQILSLEAHQHQIILTAHSADVLTAIKPNLISMFEFDGATTKVNQVNSSDLSVLRTELSDLGIHMTDLHGRDRVIWVEGQTEELVVPELLKYFCPEISAGTAVLRVEHTGTFEKKGIDPVEVAKIYQRLTNSSALVPPMVAILLDRELHKPEKCKELENASGGSLRFLPRRMLENYVLFPEPIVAVLNSLGEAVTKEQITNLLAENHVTPETDLMDMDGAKVLKKVFSKASETRHEFKKVRDVSELISYLLENEPEKIKSLGNFLREIFKLELA